VLLGNRRGDNNQALALAEALGVPFETRTMAYRSLVHARMLLRPNGIGHVSRESLRWLRAPWPDIVIGIGRRTVPIARWIQDQSEGRTSLIRIGNPNASPDLFDLVITTAQYPVPEAENVVKLPLALNRFPTPPQATDHERAWLDRAPRPHLLLSIGGNAFMWRLDLAALRLAARKLSDRADRAGGTLIAVGSPRTPPEAWRAVRESVEGRSSVVLAEESEVRYPVLVADADEQFITADSISMISEAVVSGKPVGLIPVEPDSVGRWRIAGKSPDQTRFRDPRRFWRDLEQRGFVGTVDQPKRGKVEDPAAFAVAAVKNRLGRLFR
jgi:mitochondrial fission protein ELM1